MKHHAVRPVALSVVLATLLAAGTANAVVYTVSVSLNGANEVPPIATAATGSGTLTIDTDANTVNYSIVHNVTSPTVGHIHGPAARDKSAGVIVGFPSVASPMAGQIVYPEGQEGAILGGRTYVNIHSGTFGSGEIRGQVPAAPTAAPGASAWGMGLLALALVMLGTTLVARRRQA